MAQGQMQAISCFCKVSWEHSHPFISVLPMLSATTAELAGQIIWHSGLEIFTVWLYRKRLPASACNTMLYCLFHFTWFLKEEFKIEGGAGEKELTQIEPYCVPGNVLVNSLSLLRNKKKQTSWKNTF